MADNCSSKLSNSRLFLYWNVYQLRMLYFWRTGGNVYWVLWHYPHVEQSFFSRGPYPNCNIWKNTVDKEHVIQDLQYGFTWINLQQAFSVGHFDRCNLYLPVPSGRIKDLCFGYRSRVQGIGIMWSIYMGGLYMASLDSTATLLI